MQCNKLHLHKEHLVLCFTVSRYNLIVDSVEITIFSYIIPLGTSTCIASGDPHYTSFDKRKYDFMGNCSYLMSSPCNDTTVPYFEVHTDNENRYNRPTISYVNAVHVYAQMIKISILKGGTVQVRHEKKKQDVLHVKTNHAFTLSGTTALQTNIILWYKPLHMLRNTSENHCN